MAVRNRYVRVALAERCATNLQNSVVVGQGDDYLLVERPQAKPRAKSSTPRRTKSTHHNVAAPAATTAPALYSEKVTNA